MSLPRYPRYKDSGVEWLGEVPEHWDVWKLSHAFGQIGSGTTPKSDNLAYYESGETAWLNTGDLNDGELFGCEKNVTQLALQDYSSLKLYPPGSLVIAMYGATIGKLALLRFEATVNQACCVFSSPLKVENGFLFHWLFGFRQQIVNMASGGGQPNISQEILRGLQVPCPAVREQHAIAAFLDREAGKIDTMVEEQQRLIELLKEKRQAVICHAVTKGLKPDVPMKDSGIEWLGQMPAHWNAGALTRVADRVVVGIAEAATHAYADEGIPILRSTNIRAGRIIGDILRVESEFASERGSKEIRGGDLITVRTGNAGVTAVIPPELDGCQCFTMLITTLSKLAVPEFYCYYLNGDIAQKYFSIEGWGTAQVNISVPILKALPVPIPPTEEQAEIVIFLDHAVGVADALIAEAIHAINLLQERRTALISAAVTGKIDVRGLANEDAA